MSLEKARILYQALPRLGGLRKPRKDSRNLGWQNTSFRGFADYMETPAFEEGLMELLNLASEKRTTILCAEAVPWRCHRSLIADALLSRGTKALHILTAQKADEHRLTSFGRIENGRVVYPAQQAPLL